MGLVFNSQINQNFKPKTPASKPLVELKDFKQRLYDLYIFRPCSVGEYLDWFDLLNEDGEVKENDIVEAYVFNPSVKEVYSAAVFLLSDNSIIIAVRVAKDYSVQRAGPAVFFDAESSPLSFISQDDLEKKRCSYKRFISSKEAFRKLALFCHWFYLVSIKNRDLEEIGPLLGKISLKELREVKAYLQKTTPVP